jgi:ABC-type transporter Mla subunit MlaD
MSRKVQEETGNALREMESATTDLSERSAPQAGSHQKGSMMHLNELALMLSDLLSQMQNASGSGSGMSMQQMMQQMQKMSGQQQKLNRQIQQFLNDVQGNRLSTDQQERLQQLAKQQQRIQQQLKDLAEEGGANADQVLGDLNKIAEQMEKTIQELQQGRQNERTIDRQRQILTRMLQAQQSLRTQGKKPERKGRTSDEAFNPESPDELSPQEQAETLRRDLIRALESGYAPDYEELIKRYFELLQQQQSGN